MKKAARAMSTIGLVFHVIFVVLMVLAVGVFAIGWFKPEWFVVESVESLKDVDAVTTLIHANLYYVCATAGLFIITLIPIGIARGSMVKHNYKTKAPFVWHIIVAIVHGLNLFYLLSGIFGLCNWTNERKYDPSI